MKVLSCNRHFVLCHFIQSRRRRPCLLASLALTAINPSALQLLRTNSIHINGNSVLKDTVYGGEALRLGTCTTWVMGRGKDTGEKNKGRFSGDFEAWSVSKLYEEEALQVEGSACFVLSFLFIILTTNDKIMQINLFTISYVLLLTHLQNVLYLSAFCLICDPVWDIIFLNAYKSLLFPLSRASTKRVFFFSISYSSQVSKLMLLEHPGFDLSNYLSELKWVTDA